MEINEEKLKNILTDQSEEYQRYLGAVTEDFKEQVKGVAESILIIKKVITQRLSEVEVNLSKKIDGVSEMVAENTEDITEIKKGVKDIKEKVEGQEERVTKLEVEY